MVEQILVRDVEAARMLGIGRSTFWRSVAPYLDAVKISPRTTRFRISDVTAFAEAKREERE